MENEFNLNADETIVDRISKIGYGGFWSGNNELVLTNQNIILVKKGFFGNTEEVVKYPLSDLRVVNGQVPLLRDIYDTVNAVIEFGERVLLARLALYIKSK